MVTLSPHQQTRCTMGTRLAPVGISNRHVHLSQEHLTPLFGPDYQLTPLKQLAQEGEFAARETVTIVGPRGVLEAVRVLGPQRALTQIEISLTDAYRLGLRPPVRHSGDLEGTPGISVVGPRGALTLEQGVILAARHLHIHPLQAQQWGLQDGERIKVRVPGERAQVLENVLVRVAEHYHLELHIDTDEANSGLLQAGDCVQVLH